VTGLAPAPSGRPILGRRFTFIVGSSRSGTTWLQALLGAHPSVASSSELQLFSQYVAPMMRAWRFHERDSMPAGLPLVFSEAEFMERLDRLVQDSFGRVLETKPEADMILAKIPQYRGGVEILERFLPGARYVHLIRDGRDVASSLIAASRGWGKNWAPQDVAAAARWWRNGVEAARTAGRFPGRYLELRYEDLLGDTANVLEGILEFLDLDRDAGLLGTLIDQGRFDRMKQGKLLGAYDLPDGFVRTGRSANWVTELPAIDRYAFHLEAGRLLSDLGYADEGWWRSRSWHRLSVPVAHALSEPGLRGKLRTLLRLGKRVSA